MQHPFTTLKPEYTQLLAAMAVREECRHLVDSTASRLIGFKAHYEPVSAVNGVPVIFMAASFEREASSNFNLNPAQGWPLHSISKDVPHNGPFPNWPAAALAAYRLNGLDKVGAGNWTWELLCYYGELFNGFGPRDVHHMHTSYLWGGTNIQTPGKYIRDHVFDPNVMDTQLGIVPIARRMVELDPSLALPLAPYAPPIASGIAAEPDADAKWIQSTLNALGQDPPLAVDGSYGRLTMASIRQFQESFGLESDGLAGPITTAALRQAAAALQEQPV